MVKTTNREDVVSRKEPLFRGCGQLLAPKRGIQENCLPSAVQSGCRGPRGVELCSEVSETVGGAIEGEVVAKYECRIGHKAGFIIPPTPLNALTRNMRGSPQRDCDIGKPYWQGSVAELAATNRGSMQKRRAKGRIRCARNTNRRQDYSDA